MSMISHDNISMQMQSLIGTAALQTFNDFLKQWGIDKNILTLNDGGCSKIEIDARYDFPATQGTVAKIFSSWVQLLAVPEFYSGTARS